MLHYNFIFNSIGVDAKATFKGMTTAFGSNMLCPKFVVSMKTDSSCTRFTYYGSHNDYINGVNQLNDRQLLEAIDCFFSDASCYDNARSFEDFCEELGYTSMSQYKEAKRAYDGCKRHYYAAFRLFGSCVWDAADSVREQIEDMD